MGENLGVDDAGGGGAGAGERAGVDDGAGRSARGVVRLAARGVQRVLLDPRREGVRGGGALVVGSVRGRRRTGAARFAALAATRLRLVAAAVGARALAVLASHDDVPVVLHGVIGPAREQARDHRPLVAVELMRRQQPVLLFLRERPPVDPRVQLIEPPQPTALPCTDTKTKISITPHPSHPKIPNNRQSFTSPSNPSQPIPHNTAFYTQISDNRAN
jgi:hypothetical protein